MAHRRRESDDTPMSFFSFQDIIACTTGIMVLITLMLTLELIERAVSGEGGEDLAPLAAEVAAAEKKRDELRGVVEQTQHDLGEATARPIVTGGMIETIDRAVKNLKRENDLMAGHVARTDDERLKLDKAITEVGEVVKVLKEENGDLAERLEKNKKKTPVTVIGGETGAKRVLCVEVGATECVVATIPKEGENRGFAEEVKRFDGLEYPDPHASFLQWVSALSAEQNCFVLLIRPDAVDRWLTVAGELKGQRFDVGWDVWPAEKSLLGEQ